MSESNDNSPSPKPIPDDAKRLLVHAARIESGRSIDKEAAAGCMAKVLFIPGGAEVSGCLVAIVVIAGASILSPLVGEWIWTTVEYSGLVLGGIAFGWYWRVSGRRRQLRRFKETYCAGGRLPICIECEYDLRGSPVEKCPECGTEVYTFKSI